MLPLFYALIMQVCKLSPNSFLLQLFYFVEDIKFKGGDTKSYHSNMTDIKFTPKKDFNGNVKISMEPFLASPKKSSLALSRFFSHKVTEALHMTNDLKVGEA